MAVLEVPLLSGLRADVGSLEQVRRLWQAEARVGGLWLVVLPRVPIPSTS